MLPGHCCMCFCFVIFGLYIDIGKMVKWYPYFMMGLLEFVLFPRYGKNSDDVKVVLMSEIVIRVKMVRGSWKYLE